ncbi:hypothetical protein NE237_001243 [Protea cynaroides]|uniref:Flavin-containing monooxygenase n=1 Tax=Protea cynaroides TaxID=273540 RepID=A0A9Q0QY78_9MAGN|nr:hypothetical protein NE237_001243 [Protea cynaroides]
MVSSPILNPTITNSPPPHVPFSYPSPTLPSNLLTRIVRDPKFVHLQSQSIPLAKEPSLDGKFFPLHFNRVCISVAAKTTTISSPTNKIRAQDMVKSHWKETDLYLFFTEDNTNEDMFSGCAIHLHGRPPPLPTAHRLLSFPVLVYNNNPKFPIATQNPFSFETFSHHSLDSTFARPSFYAIVSAVFLCFFGCLFVWPWCFWCFYVRQPCCHGIMIGNSKGFRSSFYQQLQEIVRNLQRLRLQEDNARQTAAFTLTRATKHILTRATEHGQLLETDIPNISPLFNQSLHYWQYSSLEDLRGLMVVVAKNQQGFRLLQNKFKDGRAEESNIIFAELKDHANELMVHPFGNYLVQRIFEACTKEQKMGILCTITKKELQLIPIFANNDNIKSNTCAIEKLFEHHITLEPISSVMLVLKQGMVILSDLYFKATLMDKYAKCGETNDGRRVFDTMFNKDHVCWTVIITAYEQSKCPKESLILFQEMQEEGLTPDSSTVAFLWVKEGLKESWSMAFRWIKLSNWLSYRATGNDTQSLCTTKAGANRDDLLIDLDELYDAVVVCNGYFTELYIVEILGIDSRLGRQIHSHNYRVLDSFHNEAAVFIGNSSSGADNFVSLEDLFQMQQLQTIAKQPDYENIWLHYMIKKAHGDDTMVFQDGSSIDITRDIVTMNDNHVGPLYKHVFPPLLAP